MSGFSPYGFSPSPRVAALVARITLLGPARAPAAPAAQVVTLTHTPCLFLESEVEPKAFTSTRAEDCVAVDEATKGERRFRMLRLKPGRTIFRVTNRNVPYELGSWVRGEGVGRVTLPSVSGGGLVTDYVVDLRLGWYVYSCPLNPTPG